MTKFCEYCGTKLDDEDAFCHNCGKPTRQKPDAEAEMPVMDKPIGALFYVNGLEAALSIFEDYIELDFTGDALKRITSRAGGVKRIYYPHIIGLQKRNPGETIYKSSKRNVYLRGSIEFEVPSIAVSKGEGKRENLIHYETEYQEEIDKIFDYVHQKILDINNLREDNISTQIKEAKELLDMGVLSQEEFDELKKYYLTKIKLVN